MPQSASPHIPTPAPTPPGSTPCSQLHSTDRSPRERLSEAGAQHWTSGSRGSPDGPGGIADSVRLLPELAQLEHLEELELVQHFAAWEGGLPSEWFAPGAFPRLRR